jgi:beta-lactamase regulating signal transducer with metallopeptidase domain
VASLLQVGLGNAAAATALASVAAIACLLLRGRRPAIAHAVWLVVLLKLLTPPLRTVPVRWPARPTPAASVVELPPAQDATDGIATVLTSAGPDETAAESEAGEVSASEPRRVATARDAFTPSHDLRHWLPTAVGALWLTGSVACLALVAVRSWRFRRLMRLAPPAPDAVRRRTAELAHSMGATHGRVPDAWFVPGAVCPMLWAPLARPPRLLLPAGLWNELTEAQRDTLIAHELAHLRRRDHWVRLVEVAATVLYWWLPVVWWARRRLREAEEQCCDAWVVWSMPRCTRHYMTAILQAVDFVSEGIVAVRAAVAVPPTACGMAAGDFRQLKRRLTMIRENETDRRHAAGRTLGRAGLAALCAGAAALLPLAPTLAQVETGPVTVQLTPAAENAESNTRPVQVQARLELRPPEAAPSAGGAPVPTTIVGPDGSVAEIRPAREIAVRSADPAAHVAIIRGGEVRLDATPASTVDEARSEVDRLSRELDQARARLAQLEQGGGAANRTPTAVRSYRVTGTAPAYTRSRPAKANNMDPPQPDSDRRLEELERKLDRLLGEVERLKESRPGSGQGSGSRATSTATLTDIAR